VVLASHDGKIVFENTLDARLDVVFRNKLPEVSFCYIIDFLLTSILHSDCLVLCSVVSFMLDIGFLIFCIIETQLES
jgi:hypothetical protein